MKNTTYLFIGGLTLLYFYTLLNFVDSSTSIHVENTSQQQDTIQKLQRIIRNQQDTIQNLRNIIKEPQYIPANDTLVLSDNLSKVDFFKLYIGGTSLEEFNIEQGKKFVTYFDPDAKAQYEKHGAVLHKYGMLEGDYGSDIGFKQFAKLHKEAGDAYKVNKTNEQIDIDWGYWQKSGSALATMFGAEKQQWVQDKHSDPMYNKSPLTGTTQIRTEEQVLYNQGYYIDNKWKRQPIDKW